MLATFHSLKKSSQALRPQASAMAWRIVGVRRRPPTTWLTASLLTESSTTIYIWLTPASAIAALTIRICSGVKYALLVFIFLLMSSYKEVFYG